MTENLIAENMRSQVYSEVHNYQVLNVINDHSMDGSELKRSDGFIRGCGNNIYPNNKKIVWKLEVKWKDVSLSWIPLKYLKSSNPVEFY